MLFWLKLIDCDLVQSNSYKQTLLLSPHNVNKTLLPLLSVTPPQFVVPVLFLSVPGLPIYRPSTDKFGTDTIFICAITKIECCVNGA
jgi:hypothetical protein